MLGLDLRDDVADLFALAAADLDALWREADIEAALRDLLPGLIDVYGSAAASVAADWYDDLRDDRGIGGSFRAITADIPDAGAQALIGWALAEAADATSLQTLILGGTQRRIANFSRQTVMGSSIADPQAKGWQRVGAGECKTGFCDMLIGRGAVYSEATADFAAHDHCKCSAVPAFDGEPIPVRPFTPSSRNISATDKARTQQWIAEHL